MVDMYELLPVFDRILVISWLCKDFGWMITNVYLGFPFGFISVSLHFFLMFADPRKTYRFYNVSLFFWVTANFLWMLLEFTTTLPSSRVHVGPEVPFGGMPDASATAIVHIKTGLFFIAAFIQITMYTFIHYGIIQMPEDENEDMICKNEAQILLRGGPIHSIATDTIILKSEHSNASSEDHHSHDISLAYIENAYIIFWISKDLFWSWGTGDLVKARDDAIFFEAAAMLFGTLSIISYLITSYIYRRNVVLLIDSITTICWIGANYVWMCGEFFIRYDNLTYDDHDEQNDGQTRIVASVLFCIGLLLQLCAIVYLSYRKYSESRLCALCCDCCCLCSMRRKGQQNQSSIEMFTFGPITPNVVRHILRSDGHQSLESLESYDDEEVVLF